MRALQPNLVTSLTLKIGVRENKTLASKTKKLAQETLHLHFTSLSTNVHNDESEKGRSLP
jgi:hypothetical protein